MPTVNVRSGPTMQAMRRVQAEVQKANVAALRAAGRAVQAEARRRAPVYEGQRASVPKGRLRKGIRAGRVWRSGLHSAAVKIGPRGPVVHKYAGKIEQRQPYMKPAYAATAAGVAVVAAEAYAKAVLRGAR